MSVHDDPEANPFASDASSSSPRLTDHEDSLHHEPTPQEDDEDNHPIEQEHPYSPGATEQAEQAEQHEQHEQSSSPPLPKEPNEQQQHGENQQHNERPKVKKYKLITKVTGLERQGKKDPIIRFDAYTTLPRFRTTTFKDIRRTHNEFVKFFDHLNGNNPECFVPSVPPATTSAGAGTEEDETKIKLRMQLWLDRITSNPILARDEEFVYFIEADFGYSPVVKKRPPATGLTRKAMKQFAPPHDEVSELAEFRPLVKDVYLKASDTHSKLDKVTNKRRNMGLSTNDFGNKLVNFAELEHHGGIVQMWRKLGKVVTTLGDLDSIKATAEAASLGDAIKQISQDAYVAKEAMTNRHLLMKELIKAQSSTKSKHQTAVRVKGSTNLSPTKVDEALTALDEATQHEEKLTHKVRRVTDNMLLEKNTLMAHFEQDLKNSIDEYVLRMIESERRALGTWESVRLDVRAVDASGGLSRLGRDSLPTHRRAALANSQQTGGDTWSGDRRDRAPDFNIANNNSSSRNDGNVNENEEGGEDDDDNELAEDDSETIVDARNAASLLAGSTF